MRRGEIEQRLAIYQPGRPRSTFRQRGDHELNKDGAPAAGLRPASVLVPLVEREAGLTVLLTQRTTNLPSHGGQISFPGGRQQPEDADVVATALRETKEEIGLDAERITVIGALDTYITGTGFLVTPIVGIVMPPFELRPDPGEVADVFEVPLAFFLDPANHELRSAIWQGRERQFYVMPFEDRYIWGATAGMLKNLYEVLVDTAVQV
ncbi:MAG: CoA pyrophosphatase [Reyranellaceae bacterium]